MLNITTFTQRCFEILASTIRKEKKKVLRLERRKESDHFAVDMVYVES